MVQTMVVIVTLLLAKSMMSIIAVIDVADVGMAVIGGNGRGQGAGLGKYLLF